MLITGLYVELGPWNCSFFQCDRLQSGWNRDTRVNECRVSRHIGLVKLRLEQSVTPPRSFYKQKVFRSGFVFGASLFLTDNHCLHQRTYITWMNGVLLRG